MCLAKDKSEQQGKDGSYVAAVTGRETPEMSLRLDAVMVLAML